LQKGKAKRNIQLEGKNCSMQTTERVKQSQFLVLLLGTLHGGLALTNTTLKNIIRHLTFFCKTKAIIHVS
jgi:hypothetical protein